MAKPPITAKELVGASAQLVPPRQNHPPNLPGGMTTEQAGGPKPVPKNVAEARS